jgi:hypothetical protein
MTALPQPRRPSQCNQCSVSPPTARHCLCNRYTRRCALDRCIRRLASREQRGNKPGLPCTIVRPMLKAQADRHASRSCVGMARTRRVMCRRAFTTGWPARARCVASDHVERVHIHHRSRSLNQSMLAASLPIPQPTLVVDLLGARHRSGRACGRSRTTCDR